MDAPTRLAVDPSIVTRASINTHGRDSRWKARNFAGGRRNFVDIHLIFFKIKREGRDTPPGMFISYRFPLTLLTNTNFILGYPARGSQRESR
jgi:hypothetical protein